MVTAADPAELNARLVTDGIAVSGLAVERRTLEDVFLELTSRAGDRVDRPGGPGRSGPPDPTPRTPVGERA